MNPGYARRMVDSRQADLQRLAGPAGQRRPWPGRSRRAAAASHRHGAPATALVRSARLPLAAAVGGLLVRMGTWLQDRTAPASSRAA